MPHEASEQELRRLMDAYGNQMLGTCFLLLRDYHQAQDVVQEAFLKAWRMGRLRQETEAAWLMRVAVNLCRDVQRSRWFRWMDRRTPVEELSIAAPAELADELLMDVQRLPHKEREVTVMHYWNDMPPEDIASALGIDRATVYRRLARARKLLRIELEGGEAT